MEESHWDDPRLREQRTAILEMAGRLMRLSYNPVVILRRIVEAEEAFRATPRGGAGLDEGRQVAAFIENAPKNIFPFSAPTVSAMLFGWMAGLRENFSGLARHPASTDRKALKNVVEAVLKPLPPFRPVNTSEQKERREDREWHLARIENAKKILQKLKPKRGETSEALCRRLVKEHGYERAKANRWAGAIKPFTAQAGARGPFPVTKAAAAMAAVDVRALRAFRKDVKTRQRKSETSVTK